MNKIFKVIWSKSKQCYIVVSEIAKNKTGKKKIVVASILAALTMTANIVTVEGAIPEGTRTDHLGLAIGTSSNSKSNQSVAIGYASSAEAPGANPENPATAVGAGANANGAGTVALGLSANATGTNAVALGGGSNGGTNKTEATAANTTAIGFNAKASKSGAAAIGSGAKASGSDSISFGTDTVADSEKAIAIGAGSKATNIGATALGHSSAATAASATAVGSLASATGTTATAVGIEASASGAESLAIGKTASATSGRALAVGTNAKATGASSVAVGSGAGNSGPLGFASSINSLGSVVNSLKTINYATTAEGDYAVALGVYANAKNSGVAVGQNALAATGGVAIGKGVLEDTGNNLAGGVAIGQDSASTGAYSLAMGRHAFASGSTSMAMGYEASANGNFAVAMGRNVTATGTSTAIGRHATASNGGLAIGSQENDVSDDRTTASAKGAVAIGKNTKATSEDAVAIGTNAQATRLNSVALGSGSTTATGATNQGSATINGITYNFAGATGNPNMQVSVGSTGATRQIKNVAAGEVSATSTDAVNGSQLYSVASAVKPLKYVSVNSTAAGTGSNVDNDGAQGGNSIAIGPSSTVTRQNGIAIGSGAQSLSEDSVVIGRDAKAETKTGAGLTTTSRAIVIGSNSRVAADVTQGVAIGSGLSPDEGAVVTGDQSIAIGGNVKVDGHSAIAIGGDDARKAANQLVSYTNKNDAEVTGTLQTAISDLTGYNLNDYKGTTASHAGVAYGASALAGNAGVAIGTAADSMTRKNDKGQVVNNKPVTNAVAIGTGARANFDNSVAIGGGSNTDRYATKQVNAIIDGVEVKWSGGENISPGDVVSFGAKGFERQLKNVAPGEVSQTSTDAINGSQIYSLARKVTNIMNGGAGSVVNVNASGQPLTKVVTGTGASKVEKYYRTVDVKDDGTLVNGAIAQTPTSLSLVNVDQTNVNQQTQVPRTLGNVADGVKDNDAVNVSQLNAAKVKYFSVNSTVTGNRDNTGATGVNAISIGPAATATKAQSIALGNSATAGGTDSIAIGNGSIAADKVAPVAIGQGAQANGDFSVALGGGNWQFKGAQANGVGTTALGTYSKTAADTSYQTVVGFGANTTKANATAIGYNSAVSTEGGVALGANSSSSTGRTVGYNPNDGRTNTYSALTGNVIRSTTGAVAVGNGTEVTRQITGVAAGTNDTDAVNVAQLKSVNLAFVGDSGFGDVNLANNDTSKRFAVKGDSTYLTTRANGNLITVSANKKDISVTNGTATAAAGMADAKNVAEAINKAVSQNAYTWNLTADNDTAGSRSTINKEGTVKFSGDQNITVARNGNTITSSLNKSIIVDSVKANNSVTAGSGSNQITLDGTTGAVTGKTFSGQSFTAGDNVLSNTTLQIGSPTNGNNLTITKDGLTSKAGTKTAKFGANGIDAGGQQITNVSSGGNVGTNAANITDVKNAVSDVTLKLDTNSKTGTVKLSESPLKVIGANGIRTDLVGTNNGSLVVGLDSNTVNATTKGIGLTGDTGFTGLKYLKDGDASFKVAGDGNLVTTKASATGVQVAVDSAKVKDLAVEAVTVSKANTADNPITVTPTAGTNSKDYAIGIDTTKLASKTDLTYRANNDTDANAQKVSLAKGLNFVNGDNTVSTVAADGKVSYDLNAATKTKIDDSATAVARNISLGADSGTSSSQSLKDGDVAFNVKGATGDYVSTNMNGNTVEVSTKRATINSDANNGTASVTGNDGLATAKNVADAINKAADAAKAGAAWNLTTNSSTTDKTSVQGGDTVDLINGDNIVITQDGTDKKKITVATKKDLTVDSVTAGNTVINTSGLTNGTTAITGSGITTDKVTVGGISIDKTDGINAGGKAISNVASGGTTDTNAANIGDVKQAVANLSQNLNITDGTNNGTVDLKNQKLNVAGANGVTATVNNQTITVGLDADTVNATTKGIGLTADTGTTGNKYLKDGDVSFAVTGDGNLVSTSATAAGVKVAVDAAKVKDLAVDAVTVSKDAQADNPITVTPTAGTNSKDYAIGIDTTKLAAKTDLTYRANNDTDANAKKVSLAKGLNFVNGTLTTASIDNDGVVKYDVNTAAITAGTDGTVTGPTTDGVATAQNVADAINAAKKASKTEITANTDEAANATTGNVILTSTTAADGHTIYDVKLNNKVTLGTGANAVTIDGTTGKITAKNAAIGGVTLDGDNSHVTGLSNTTWNGTATTGRAATEDQLKAVADTAKATTDAVNLKFSGDTNTSAGVVNLKDDTFNIVGDGKYVTTDANGKDLTVKVSEAEVKKSAVAAVTVSTDTTDANNPISVTPTTSADGTTKDYKVTIDGTKIANKTNLSYKANDSTAKQVSLADGLNFKNGTLTTASIDDAGVVKYDVNTATITAGTDGTVTGPTTDGVATAQNVADAINAAKKAAKTEITANTGEAANATTGNVTLTSTTATDGHTIYDVKLNDKVTLGTGANAVTIDGTAGTVTGLTNKDWTPGVTKAVTGRAATEDQLQKVADAASSQTWNITADKAGTTGAQTGTKKNATVGKDQTVELVAGDNLTINQDERKFTYSLNKDLAGLTSVSVGDGTTETIKLDGATGKVTAKNAVIGGVTVDGDNSHVTGLSNTTWNGTATTGRAATEDQLKAVSDTAKATTDAVNLKFSGDTNTSAGVVNLKDDTFNIVGDGKYVTTDANGKDLTVKVSEAEVKKSAVAAVTVSTDTTDANNPISVTPTTSADGTTKDYKVTIDGTKIANKTNLSYKANDGTAKQVSLADGLNFKNGTLTTASIDDAGVVKYDVNTATITAGTDGTVTGPTTDGVATAQNVADAINAAKKAAKTEITANTGEVANATTGNITLTSTTAADGHTIYDVKLNDKVTLGTGANAVTIDGTAGKATVGTAVVDGVNNTITTGGANAVSLDGAAGKATIGSSVVDGVNNTITTGGANAVSLDGAAGTVTGLTNKDWTPGVTKAVTGRAATEDQLQKVADAASSQTWNITADKAGTTGAQTGTKKNATVGKDQTVELVAGDNLTINQDERKFTYSLNKDLAGLTSVSVGDGTTETIKLDGATGKVTAKNAVIGGVTVDGDNSHVTGLSNTTWNGTATTGRAATEDQLKAVADTAKATTDAVNLKFSGDTNTSPGVVNLKDDTLGIIGDGKYVSTDANGKNLTVKVSEAEVKKSAVAAVTVSTDTTDANNPLTVTPTTSADGTTKDYKVTIDGAKIANKTNLSYKANNGTAKQVSLADGLNFKNGTLTTASIDDKGVVKYDVNTASITAGTDGTITGPTTDGVATAKNVADAINAAKKASKTEITANTGEAANATTGNVSLTSTTAADGHTIYDVKLNDKVTLGTGANAVTIDGTTGAITGKTANIGGVTVNGTANTIGGLSNTTWNGTATTGRAATEDQLKAVADAAGSQTWEITADKKAGTSGAQTGTKENAKVGKDDKVSLIAGENLTVDQSGKNFTYSLNTDLVKMNSATFLGTGTNTTVITGDSITQTAGTQTNTSTAGGNTVADGTKSTKTTADGQVIKDGTKSNKSTVDNNVIDDGNGNVNTSNATSNTITDGTNTSTITAGKAQIGTVGIDGVASKITTGGTNAVVVNGADGTVKTGNVTVTGGTTNDITGLSNTTLSATDFATKGRAATEEQLKAATGATTLKFTGDVATNTGSVNLKDDTFGIKGDGKYISTDVNGKNVNLTVSEAEVKKSAVAAVTVSTDTTDANNPLTVTPTTSADGTTKDYKVTIDGTKIANKTNLSYKANNGTAKQVSLADGLDFTNGTLTTASIDDKGVVKYDVNTASITAGTDGTITGPTTDGVATAKNVADAINAAKKASKTEITANTGEAANATTGNVSLTSTTAADGHTIYDVKLNDKVTLGTGANVVTIDGTAGKATIGSSIVDGVNNTFTTGGASSVTLNGATGTITGKTANIGGVTVDGTNNHVMGLANKDWTPGVTQAVSGRAATEDQLQKVSDAVGAGWKVNTGKVTGSTGESNGATSTKVASGEEVQFQAGNNLIVDQNGKTVAYSLNKALKDLESATFNGTGTNKTVITGDSITQTAGTQTNTSTAGGNTVADGTKSTETTAAGQVIKDGTKSNKSTVDNNVIDDGNGNVNTSNATSNTITDGTNTTETTSSSVTVKDNAGNSTVITKDNITTGVGGNRITLDGTAGKATIGSSIVDGVNNTFTTGGANAVKLDGAAGTIKTGNVTVTGGTTNDITGLSNTTVTATDFATKGRAATEEQLKAVGEQTWQITADKDTATSGAQTGTKKDAKVGKDDKVQLIAGENMTVNQNERDFTFTLNKNLVKMNSATFLGTGTNTTVIIGDSITQTAGTQTNTSTAAGNTVADGTKSTETTAAGQVIKDGAKSNKSTVDNNVIDDGNGNVNTSNATSNTITDGTNTSTITAGKATIGTSVVDGVNNTFTTGGANAVKVDGAAGTIKTGNVTVTGGTTNDITGLSNTTVTATDFATKGRAATEEQLKAVGEQTWQITADKDTTTSGAQTGTKKDAKVGKDDKVQLIAGENMTVNQNERDFTFTLNKDLVKMNSATFLGTGTNTTVITGDSITQTAGTQTNTSTAGGNTVADGTKSTKTTADGQVIKDGTKSNKSTVDNNVIDDGNGNVNTSNATSNTITDGTNTTATTSSSVTVKDNAGNSTVITKDNITMGVGGNKITLDGTAGKATIGSSIIDGVNKTFTTGGTNAVTLDGAASTVKTGTVTVTGGTTNDITGLSNTTVNSADFATKGRAATEEQLKAVGEQTWQITTDKKTGTSGAQTGLKENAKVGKDDKVSLIAGENLTVDQAGKNFTYSLNSDLVKMNSATFLGTGTNTTVITGDSITQTAGTQTNTSTAVGNTVADGTKSTETTAAGQVIKDGTKTNTSTVDENTIVDGTKSNKSTVDGNTITDGTNTTATTSSSVTVKDNAGNSTVITKDNITTGVGGNKITLDGTAGKATIGSSVVDGVNNTFTTGGTNAVTMNGAAGTIKTGTVTVTGGTTNDITGLSNTTVNSTDFATKGRAATEEQLKAVGEQTWQITADKDTTTSGARTGTKKDAKVGKDDKVQLIAGENMTINQNERDFTFTLNKDLVKMNSATFLGTGSNTTVITGNSITQTAGTQTNTSTAGGNTVADGTKSTETTAAGQVIKDGAKSNKSTVDSNVIDDGNGNVNTSNATSNTITDGTNTSTVTAGKANIGNIAVDGVNNKITMGNGATPVTLDGANGHLDGLTNTTWVPGVTKATTGRAATEDQLQQVSDAVGAGWKVNTGTVAGSSGVSNGAASTKVSSGEEVKLQAGDNLVIDQNGKTVSYSLNKDLTKMNSATFEATGGKTTVIKGDSIVQTDGGKTNTSNAAGNTVADGTKSTATTAAGTTITDGAKTNTSTADKNVIDDGAGNKSTFTKDGITITKTGKDTVSLTSNGLDNGNNKIVNVAAGVANTDAVNVSQLKEYAAKSTTELTANNGEAAGNTKGNIVLTKTTAADGHTIYDNKLNDKITLGAADPTKAVTVDGTAGTIAVADKITLNGKDGKAGIGTVGIDGKDGIITTGGTNSVKVDGATGTVTGLTNKTWTPGSIVSGRAATEDQLKDAVADSGWKVAVDAVDSGKSTVVGTSPEKIKAEETVTFKAGNNMMVTQTGKSISYAVNPELTDMKSATFKDAAGNTTVTNGNGITITPGSANPTNPHAGPVSLTKDGLNNGNNQIKGVAPGTDPTDAVNVSQLNTSNANTSQAINQIAGEVQHVGAHAAAMAALKPIQYDPLEPTQVMAGVGNYRGETAAALGLAHYTNENTMFNVGVSVGGNHNMVNAGVTHKFGYSPEKKNIPDRYKAGPISSVYVMQDEVSSLKKENAEQKYVIADQAARLNTLEAENERQRQELAETKQGLDDLRAAVDKLLAAKG